MSILKVIEVSANSTTNWEDVAQAITDYRMTCKITFEIGRQ